MGSMGGGAGGMSGGLGGGGSSREFDVATPALPGAVVRPVGPAAAADDSGQFSARAFRHYQAAQIVIEPREAAATYLMELRAEIRARCPSTCEFVRSTLARPTSSSTGILQSACLCSFWLATFARKQESCTNMKGFRLLAGVTRNGERETALGALNESESLDNGRRLGG